MTHVKLIGEIGEKFGSDWHMNVKSFRDMFKLIDCQKDGFREYLIDCADKGINFTVQNGEDLLDTLEASLVPVKDTVIITPVAAGAGTSDVLKVVVGVLLLWYGASWVSGQGWATTTTTTPMEVALPGGSSMTVPIETTTLNTAGQIATWGVQALGVGLAMSGVTGLLTPDSPSEAGKSYLFNGPQNNIKQGVPVPVCYGELIVGGAVMNFGFIEDKIENEMTGYNAVWTDENSPANSDEGYSGDDRGRAPIFGEPGTQRP